MEQGDIIIDNPRNAVSATVRKKCYEILDEEQQEKIRIRMDSENNRLVIQDEEASLSKEGLEELADFLGCRREDIKQEDK